MKLLLAVDDSEYSAAAVQAVLAQFRPQDTDVHVFHAVEWLREMPSSFRFGEGPSYAQHIQTCRDQSLRKAGALVERIAHDLRAAGFRTTTETPDVDPRHGIIDSAVAFDADLIVLGSHGRRGLNRILLGSVAEAVVRHAACSVHIVRVRHATPA